MKTLASQPIISIVICTYNRSKLLTRCLTHLLRSPIPSAGIEILVVDNNSSDNTRNVVNEFDSVCADKQNVILRYILESNQGLSNARNRGYLEAQGAWVAYLDDDAFVANNWVALTIENIRTLDSETVLFGAQVTPEPDTKVPDWAPDMFVRKPIEQGSQAKIKPNEARRLIAGSNMVILKKVLISLRGFDPALGIVKNSQKGGEETELFFRLGKKGQIWFTPELVVYHPATISDITLKKVLQRAWFGGLIENKKRAWVNQKRVQLIDLLSLPNAFRWFVLGLFYGILNFRFMNKKSVTCLANSCHMLGLFVGFCKHMMKFS